MARTNTKQNMVNTGLVTHEGAPAKKINAEQMLRRSTMSALLWEDEFYEDGVLISKRVADLIPSVDPVKVAEMAIEAREKMKLRHMPLFMVREMARHDTHKKMVSGTLTRIIQRADEFAEFVALYFGGKKQPLSAQVKLGLAGAFMKTKKIKVGDKFKVVPYFDEYQYAKYNRDNGVKLRDALFLSHPKPINKTQEKLFKKIVENKLAIPETWETMLSAGKDAQKTWEKLMDSNKLGALALLRNLRNMEQAGVSKIKIKDALSKMNVQRVLPFRFIAAARYAPKLESELELAMFKSLDGKPKLAGHMIGRAHV